MEVIRDHTEHDYTEVLIGIRKIIRSINLESKRIEKEYGVSIPQVLCLKFVSTNDNLRVTSSDIKNYLNLNASTVTGLVKRLEAKGLVAKLPNSRDKRTTFVAITTKGIDLLEQLPPLLHDRLTTKLKDLASSDVEVLLDAVNRIADFVGAQSMDASPVLAMEDPIGPSE